MTAREIIKLLKNDGWRESRAKGSHIHFTHDTKRGTVTVSVHSGDLSPGTLNSILKQSGLKKQEKQ